jgi:ribose transport system permease protein
MDKMNKSNIKKIGLERIPLIVLIVEIIVFSLASSNFYQFDNIRNILTLASIDGLIAIGLTYVLISGGLDLSIGSNKAFSATITILTLRATGNIFIAVIAGILAGTTIGFINGIIITKGKVAPFIATLGTLLFADGLTLLLTRNNTITVSNFAFADIVHGRLFYINFPIWNFILFVIIGYLLLNKTRIGKYIYGIGGQESVCRLMGVNTDLYKIMIYSVCGAFCGISGVLLASRASAASPEFGTLTMFIVIGAVILGGTSLRGGEGGVLKSLIGLFIYITLQNAFGILSVEPFYQMLIWGTLLVIATILDNWRFRREMVRISE